MNKNYYVAKIFAKKAFVDIRINDIPLLKLDTEDDFTAEIPINYLIESSGCHTLMIQVYPNIGSILLAKESECSVNIFCYDGVGDTLVEKEKVCSLRSSNDNKRMIIPDVREKHFFAEVSYNIRRWGDCEKIEEDLSISSKVAKYYQKIWNLLSEKNYEGYLDLIQERERIICKSLMINEENIRTRNELFFDCLEDGFELCPMKGKKTMEFYAGRRIVSVLDVDLKPAIRFKNFDSGEILTLEILLGIKKGQKEFSII